MLSREMLSRCPTFNRPGGGRFQIGWDAAIVVGRYVQDEGHKPEAGGVLLGRHIHNSQDIVVDQVTTPMRDFVIDVGPRVGELNCIYSNSTG